MTELSIIMYHYVRPLEASKYPNIKGLDLRRFKRQLDYIEKNYHVVTSSELIATTSMEGHELPRNACLLTFDDGYKDHFDYVLPELLRRGLHGSFFPPVKCITERSMLNVNKIHYILANCNDYDQLVKELENLCLDSGLDKSDLAVYRRDFFLPSRFDFAGVAYFKRMLQYVLEENLTQRILEVLLQKYVKRDSIDIADELYMTTEDIKKLLELGMYVGSHTYSHQWLEKISKVDQEREIDLSIEFLKAVGAPIEDWIMCYPYGSYNLDTMQILIERKCAVGLTTKVGVADLSLKKFLELQRFDTNDFPQ